MWPFPLSSKAVDVRCCCPAGGLAVPGELALGTELSQPCPLLGTSRSSSSSSHSRLCLQKPFIFSLGEPMNIFMRCINERLLWSEISQPLPCTGLTAWQSPFCRPGCATACATALSRATTLFTATSATRGSQGSFPAAGALSRPPASLQLGTTGIASPGMSQCHAGTSGSGCAQRAQHQGVSAQGHYLPRPAAVGSLSTVRNSRKAVRIPTWLRSGPSLGLLSQFQGCPLVTAVTPQGLHEHCQCSLLGFFRCSSVLNF